MTKLSNNSTTLTRDFIEQDNENIAAYSTVIFLPIIEWSFCFYWLLIRHFG